MFCVLESNSPFCTTPDEPAHELQKSGKKQYLSFSTTCGSLCSLATLLLAKFAIAPTNSLYHESRFW